MSTCASKSSAALWKAHKPLFHMFRFRVIVAALSVDYSLEIVVCVQSSGIGETGVYPDRHQVINQQSQGVPSFVG